MFSELTGEIVVLDALSPYVFIGVLVRTDLHFLILEDADVHDFRDTQTTRDLYVLDAREHGVRSNRRRVFVRRDEIVAVSLFREVVK
ncbi:MAG: hypothetical protein CMJ81_02035 [Planctomycetaceae bacterium]|nr:hypothetical protein [Planctomycetaceae bacterium]